MCDIVIFGNGKMAQLANFYFSHDSAHKIAAFTVDGAYIQEKEFQGLPVVSFEEIEVRYPPDRFKMFVAIGYSKVNKVRADKYLAAKGKGYHCVSYISSKAILWDDLQTGENCFILENQVIEPLVRIGNNVILWSGGQICHDTVIADHCWLSSHVVVPGGVTIGAYSFIGVNATLRDHIEIGQENIIGAGAIILKSTKDKEVYIAERTKPYNHVSFSDFSESL